MLPDGSIGIVIGDVMGHDIAAVTAMAQLRTMVRSGAWLGASASRVVEMADELAKLSGITEMATLFYGRLVRDDAGARLHYCNAGHLQPLLRNRDGTVTSLEGGNRTLLGALDVGAAPAVFTEGVVDLPQGALLLLYSDGLVERGNASVEEATDALRESLSEFPAHSHLDELCQRLLAAPGAGDDTTVFMVRATDPQPPK